MIGSLSRYPQGQEFNPRLGTRGTLSEKQFFGSTQALKGNIGWWYESIVAVESRSIADLHRLHELLSSDMVVKLEWIHKIRKIKKDV